MSKKKELSVPKSSKKQRQKQFDLSIHVNCYSLPKYQPLQDPYLNDFFRTKTIQCNLRNTGLLSKYRFENHISYRPRKRSKQNRKRNTAKQHKKVIHQTPKFTIVEQLLMNRGSDIGPVTLQPKHSDRMPKSTDNFEVKSTIRHKMK